jgi:hypothetical protein
MSMLVWAYHGNAIADTKQSSNETVLADKRVLIEEFAALQEQGKISLSGDIVLVAEGCDTGDYLPLVCAAFTRDGKNRVIRPFLINGSEDMVNKACKVAYRLFNTEHSNTIFGGVCNAFDCPPSELKQFPASQKIFTPFRMGVVGGYEEIRTYLSTRIPIMGLSGLCCFCMLLDTETTRGTLEKELKGQIITRQGNGYTEFFRVVRPGMYKSVTKQLSEEKAAMIKHSLESNPIHQECLTFPCYTAFEEKTIRRLVKEVGGKLLDTDTLKNPIRAQTDSRADVDIRGLIIMKK